VDLYPNTIPSQAGQAVKVLEDPGALLAASGKYNPMSALSVAVAVLPVRGFGTHIMTTSFDTYRATARNCTGSRIVNMTNVLENY
jgi:hypothetical protein